MKTLLVAAALTALFAASPALAQRDRGGDRPDRGQAGQATPSTPAPQTQAAPNGGNGGRDRGGFDRQNRGPDRGFNRDSARGPQTPAANPPASAAPPNADRRGGFRDGRDNGQTRDDRGRFNQDNRTQGNQFPDNRAQGNRFQDNRGQDRGRRDYSALRRNFTARNRFRGGFYRPPQGFYNRRWVYGEILPRSFWARDYWLSNFYDYDLPPPPPGTVWVRYGNDALLIDDFDGQIIEVVYNVFY